jgi:osmotically-inducible protein OsmY
MDAWIQGRLESAYIFNQHLNPFTIDVDVDNGIVALTGTVESDIDKDLAGEIAKGIDKVEKVNNYLEVVPGTRSKMINSSPDESDFKQFVIDASITATVLTKLIANNNTSVMELRVNTESGVVNLKGKVDSEQEKQLVEQIAKNSPNVRDVNNELTVTSM